MVSACFNTQFWKGTETSNQASVLPYDTSDSLPNTQNTVGPIPNRWKEEFELEWFSMVDPSWPLVTLGAQVVEGATFSLTKLEVRGQVLVSLITA